MSPTTNHGSTHNDQIKEVIPACRETDPRQAALAARSVGPKRDSSRTTRPSPWRILKVGRFLWNSIRLLQKCERDQRNRRKVIASAYGGACSKPAHVANGIFAEDRV